MRHARHAASVFRSEGAQLLGHFDASHHAIAGHVRAMARRDILFGAEFTSQNALRQRHPAQQPHAAFFCHVKQRFLRLNLEYIVSYLQGLHEVLLHEPDAIAGGIDRHSAGADLALLLQPRHTICPVESLHVLATRAVKLVNVNAVAP